MSAYRFIDALRGTARRIPAKIETTGREVLRRVSEAHGVPIDAIIGTRRFPYLVSARQDAVDRLTELGWSQHKIGKLLNRDHTSILNLQRRGKKHDA